MSVHTCGIWDSDEMKGRNVAASLTALWMKPYIVLEDSFLIILDSFLLCHMSNTHLRLRSEPT